MYINHYLYSYMSRQKYFLCWYTVHTSRIWLYKSSFSVESTLFCTIFILYETECYRKDNTFTLKSDPKTFGNGFPAFLCLLFSLLRFHDKMMHLHARLPTSQTLLLISSVQIFVTWLQNRYTSCMRCVHRMCVSKIHLWSIHKGWIFL